VKNQFNMIKVTGSNINGSLGIGSDEESTEKVHQLYQFNNKKIYQIALGDFHTLAIVSGCNCTDPIKHPDCQG
jgi:alpha-tubulin suppressor-like RCC1 family protein